MASKKDNTVYDASIVPRTPIEDTQANLEDLAAKFLSDLDRSITEQPIAKAEFCRVRWKTDLTILPLIAVTGLLAAVDKIIISNAIVFGMREDLHLVGNQFSWAGSIFYFGYLLFEWPTAYLIQRLPVAKVLVGMVFCWSVLLFCTAASQNFTGLATVRFFMGAAEAGVFPAISIITVMWYDRKEQPVRLAILFNQLATIFVGIIPYGIGHTHTKISLWRLMFIVLGAVSFAWAIFLLLFLPDSPTTAWYFSKRERYVCVKRVQGNNTGMENKHLKWSQVKECIADSKTWLLATFVIAQSIPNSGIITFGGIIVSGLGYDPLTTALLNIPTGIIATVWVLVLAVLCARLKNKRCIIIGLANIFPMTSAILLWKLDRGNKLGRLGVYFAFFTYWAPYVISISLQAANVSGHTKKVTMNAIFFLSYCTGSIIGPQVFRANDAPNYPRGYTGMLCCFVVAGAAISAYGFLCKRENGLRDRKFSSRESTADDAGVFSDRTDKEKPEFRYIY